MFAISRAASLMIEAGLQGRSIEIRSDSQAALRAISGLKVSSLLVLECRRGLNQLAAAGNAVQLSWVPGHAGQQGNEQADALARQGADIPWCGPQPALPVSLSLCKAAVKRYITNVNHSRHAKCRF